MLRCKTACDLTFVYGKKTLQCLTPVLTASLFDSGCIAKAALSGDLQLESQDGPLPVSQPKNENENGTAPGASYCGCMSARMKQLSD